MLIAKRIFPVLILFIASIQLHARSLPDFAELVEENGKAVVNISTRHKIPASQHPWGKLKDEQGGELDIPENSPFGELFKHFFGDQGMPQQPQDATSLGSGFISQKMVTLLLIIMWLPVRMK